VLLSGIAVAASDLGPQSAATPSAAAAPGDVVTATNNARRAAGCAPVRLDERLTAAAQAHASDMARAGLLSHTGEDGSTPADRIRNSGYPNAFGENIASGQPTAAEVMHVWMGTAGYRRTIEDCAFTAIGVGYDPDGHHWVQDFGG
jgi:uncharacterized protein YkwD